MVKRVKLMQGDNLESLKKLPDNCIDSVVSDPPYGLSFMGKKWDYDVPSVEFWKEVYRVLKPGGHVLSFGGTRTYHRMVVNIEDAGFEIRDQIMWIYGSGFPKSLNIGIAIDKQAGLIGHRAKAFVVAGQGKQKDKDTGLYLPNPDRKIEPYKAQNEYEGWGTALKPANEPICVARKPLSEKSVAENVLKWGTGGLNIDGCRVGTEGGTMKIDINKDSNTLFGGGRHNSGGVQELNEGRFPANLILDEEAAQMLDEQSGISKPSKGRTAIKGGSPIHHSTMRVDVEGHWPADNGGGASRFFYIPKVSRKERNMGLDGFEDKVFNVVNGGHGLEDSPNFAPKLYKNIHPTVKPVQLMAYLCRLVTPPNGIVLDPFMGSGSTGIAAQLEGFRFVGMEMDENYFKIAEARIENYEKYREFAYRKEKASPKAKDGSGKIFNGIKNETKRNEE